MHKLILASALVLVMTPVMACNEASVENVTSSGIIILDDGTTWQTDDTSTVSTWAGDDVLVCDDKMINKSSGEEVDIEER